MKKQNKKGKIVQAYPNVSMLSQIQIREKEIKIDIGGFSIEGGFYLRSPYKLVKKETTGIGGKITYYNFVKSSNERTKQEKALRKLDADSTIK